MLMSLMPAASFFAIYAFHFLYVVFFKTSGCENGSVISYFTSGDVFIGFSFALSGAFTAWSLARFIRTGSNGAAAGAAGGTAFLAGIAAAGCFFSGCCGSPMLIVYANVLGIQSLEMPKWIMALLTLLSISTAWWLLHMKGKRGAGVRTAPATDS